MRRTSKLAFGCGFFCFGKKKNNFVKYFVYICNKPNFALKGALRTVLSTKKCCFVQF